MSASDSLLRQTPIERIEDEIVALLKDGGLSSKFLIQAFPDTPDNFDLADAEKAALVQYTGSRYAAPEGSGGGAQMRTPEFAIHLYLRSVGGPLRAPFEIEQIRLAVQDRRVAGGTLYVTRDGLIDQDETLWRYLIEIACTPILAAPLPRPRPRPFMTDFNKTGDA